MPEPGPIEFRIARPEDSGAIAAIWRGAYDAGALAGFDVDEIARLVEGIAVAPDAIRVAAGDGEILGFLHIEAHVIAVRPDVRRRGIGRGLVDATERALAEIGQRLLLWRPDGNPGAAAFYGAIGYRHHSSLWQMSLDSIAGASSPPTLDGFTLVAVDRVTIEDYVALFNEVFVSHPTPLSVTPELVRWVHARPDFDPRSIGVLRTASGGELVGFCRTRVHGPGEPGEIALIGVRPAWRGRGLGRWLLHWGIAKLAAAGLSGAQLSVESENEHALALYEQAGFVRSFEWKRFGRSIQPPSSPLSEASSSA